jgi:hypothetical protein
MMRQQSASAGLTCELSCDQPETRRLARVWDPDMFASIGL